MSTPTSLLLLLDVSSLYDPDAVEAFLEALRAHPDADLIEVRPFGNGLLGPHYTWLPAGFVHPSDWMAALPGAEQPLLSAIDPLRGDSLWLAHAWRDLVGQPEVQDGRVQAVGFLTDLSGPLPRAGMETSLPPSVQIHWFPARALDGDAQERLAAWTRDVAALTGGEEARVALDWALNPADAAAGFVQIQTTPRRSPRP